MNQNDQVVNNNKVIDENAVLRLNKKKKKWPFILLLFLFLCVCGASIYLFLESRNKYNTYIVVGADLKSTEKVYEAGRPYFIGTYKYIVDGKEYKYKYSKKFEGSSDNVDNVIQIRYNPSDPSILYDSREPVFYTIIIAVSGLLAFCMIGIIISIVGRQGTKIVTVVVFDILTCIGGRKVYMKTISLDNQDIPLENIEYFSYFTDKVEYFPIGKKLKFNAYKYGEALTTESYNGKVVSTINIFKLTDFIFYK